MAGNKFSIVWNHRWEHDKWPECLFLGLLKLKEKGIAFDLHVLGQQFRRQPPIFAQIKNEFGENIRSWGTIKNVEIYRQVLRSMDVVVSTAVHDFQGLAVLEAVASGCVPVVPDRLAYPQFFQRQFRYLSFIKANLF